MAPASVLSASKTALITGAASGIGLAVAQLCRSHGMKLALVDNNASLLARAKESLQSSSSSSSSSEPPTTETYTMDVSQIDSWRDLRTKVKSSFGGIDFLMLNAAVGEKGEWTDPDYFRKVLDVNYMGYVNGVCTFLDDVRSEDPSRPTAIVLTGSKQGITNPPGNPAYNCSKAAVKALAEQLSFELRDSATSVHLLIPGWTFTGLSGGEPGSSKEKPEGAWWPSQVAGLLEQRMKERQFWVVCPDGDVTEVMDKRRMLWSAGDAVYGRLPLSRWREEYGEESKKWMEEQ